MILDIELDVPKLTKEQLVVSIQFLAILILSFNYILPGAGTDAHQHRNWNKISSQIELITTTIVEFLPVIAPFILEEVPATTYFYISLATFVFGTGIKAVSNCEGGNISPTCNKAQYSTKLFGAGLIGTSYKTAAGGILAYLRDAN